MSEEARMTDSLEEGLLAASQEALSRGSITPLLKKELWLKIQSRRLSEGKEELVVPHTPSHSFQISQAEKAKKLRRQEQNRRAAKKFRSKQKRKFGDVLERIEQLDTSNQQLEEEHMSLIREKNSMLVWLCEHLQHCQTRLEPALLASLPGVCQHPQGSEARPESPLPSLLDRCQHLQKNQICSQHPVHSSDACVCDGTVTTEPREQDVTPASEGGQKICQVESDFDNTLLTSAQVPEYACSNCVCDGKHDDTFLSKPNGNVCICARSCCDSSLNPPVCSDDDRVEINADAERQKCHSEGSASKDMGHVSVIGKLPAGGNGSEGSVISVPHADASIPPGFECGMMFLQIVDGNVRVLRGDNSLKLLSTKLADMSVSDVSLSGSDTSVHSKPSSDNKTPSLDNIPSSPEPKSRDERPLSERRSSSKRKQPNDESPSCSRDTKAETPKNRNMTLYHLSTSEGLPFFVLRNSVQLAGPDGEERRQRDRTQTGKQSQTSTVTRSGSTDVPKQDPCQPGSQFTSPKVRSKRKAGEKDKDGERRPVNKRRKKSETVTRHRPLISPLKAVGSPSTNSFTIHEDGDDGKHGNQSLCVESVSNRKRDEGGDAQKPITEPLLRDQTNIRINRLNRDPSTSKTNLTTANDCDLHENAFVRLSPTKNKRSTEHLSKTKSLDYLTGLSSPAFETFTLTRDSNVSHAVSDNVTSEDQTKAANNSCLTDRTAVDCQSVERETYTQSPSSLKQTSSNTLYDADFQTFLTNCFESLNKTKSHDSTVRSQGLILLTSLEMRLPGNISQGQEEKAAEDRQEDMSRLDLPAVDTVWLMNMLRETTRRGDDHDGNTTTDTTNHQISDKGHSLSSSVWLFSGLKSLVLDAENPVAETSPKTKDPQSPQRFHALPVLPGCAEEVLEHDLPTSSLPSAGQLLRNISGAIMTTECLGGAAVARNEAGAGIPERNEANRKSTEKDIPRRAISTTDRVNGVSTTQNEEVEAAIALQLGTERGEPESLPASESVTLTSTEYGHLVDTLLTSLATASSGNN